MLSDFRIMRSTKVSESGDSILLSDLQGNQGSIRKVLNKREILRQHSLIYIHEFFDNGAIQVEQLHGTNLEAGSKNRIKTEPSCPSATMGGLIKQRVQLLR